MKNDLSVKRSAEFMSNKRSWYETNFSNYSDFGNTSLDDRSY